MPQIVADPLSPSCYPLFPEPGIQESQELDPDPFLPRARRARAVCEGDLRQSARAVSDLVDRKPHLLRPLAEQLLPPPASFDPAEHLGIDVNSVCTAEDCRQVLTTVLAAIGRGEIAPAKGARIAERMRGRLRAARRLARVAQLIEESI